MARYVFLNLRTSYGVETVDSLCRNDFRNISDYKQEAIRLKNEYHIAGMPVYFSRRACKEWYQQHKND